jgi:hypothetical protein
MFVVAAERVVVIFPSVCRYVVNGAFKNTVLRKNFPRYVTMQNISR